MMDEDLDFSLTPSGTIYPTRAVRLDPATQDGCYMGNLNSMCVGITPQQSEVAPGMIGYNTPPFVLAEPAGTAPFVPGSVPRVSVYGPGRRCLLDIDPNFGGQIAPNDLLISGNGGLGTKASPTGPWNQWIIGIALSFANGGQSCNVKVVIFPWMPTGS